MSERATRVFHDEDADLGVLEDERIAVVGYGNQGRSQAQNLRDSGLDVRIGVRRDATRERAAEDGFRVLDVAEAVAEAEVVLMLVPDEAMPEIFARDVRPHLREGALLLFASGYNVAFDLLDLPEAIDVGMVAPRMIGPGVRESFVSGRGFPSFVCAHRDATGRALDRVLAVARALGSTRVGCLELSMRDEAVLDLFNEQGFGPAFGVALMGAIHTLVEAGFPPEAVMLEILLSGELAYSIERMVRDGVLEQMSHHSNTSQYGSMTRGVRFADLPVRERMHAVLEDIRSGAFAKEWSDEQREGLPTLRKLLAVRETLPVREWEERTRVAFRMDPGAEV